MNDNALHADNQSGWNHRNPNHAGTIGRFELRKALGHGAQSTVWLAFDPRVEREAALKVMRVSDGSDEQAVAQWLQEARRAGRVTHPNIVPLFEADIQGRQPYLVFEFIAGKTLTQHSKARGALPAPEAVSLMMDVLDAVSIAHAAGVIHRDLKPSNILVDNAGRARVLDFGIAACIKNPQSKEPVGVGSIGYLSPEAANGEAPGPGTDVFSAGLVLAELLLGRPLIQETDPYRAVYRVVHEQLGLPPQECPDVDDRLRAIVSRALALDPDKRFATARQFQAALEEWFKPAAPSSEAVNSKPGPNNSTLEFLLRRMRHKSDFPALSDAVVRIQSMATSETESVGSVTNEILKDVALTNKLLRLVNSVEYARGGNISTVSRAVTLVGFNGIRNMALSLVLLEHMQDKAHAAQLKEEFLRCLMAGNIGGELCPVQRDSEEAFIGSMFQNLGRLLTQFYFPEESSRIRSLVQNKREPISESAASAMVLGLTFDDLGVGVSKTWGLPEGIQRCMRKPIGAPPSFAPTDNAERIRWIAQASNEIADVLLQCDPKEADARIALLTKKYAAAIGVGAKDIQLATTKARQKLIEMATAMELRVAPGSAAAKLLKFPDDLAKQADAIKAQAEGNLAPFTLQATQTTGAAGGSGTQATAAHSQVADTLSAGIQDITNAMVEDFKLSDVLRMILETMFRALEFERIIFCMRDAKTETIVGRFGLGSNLEKCLPVFKVNLKAATPDLFGVVCIKGTDTMINDATQDRIVQRLPDWYRKTVNAPTFLLLPLHIKGAPFGLIYADKAKPDALQLNEKELALLRTLRNQAVMAFKQSS
jgi:serine/threonine protein kinase